MLSKWYLVEEKQDTPALYGIYSRPLAFKWSIQLFNICLYVVDFYGLWWILYFHPGKLRVKDSRFFSSQCLFICLLSINSLFLWDSIKTVLVFDISILNRCEYLNRFCFSSRSLSSTPIITFPHSFPQIFIGSSRIRVGCAGLDSEH